MKPLRGLDPITGLHVGRIMRLSFDADGGAGGGTGGTTGAPAGAPAGGEGGTGAGTGTEGKPPAGEPNGTEGKPPEGKTEGKIEDLPEWAQQHIRDLRKESGDRRVENKSALEAAISKATEEAYKKMGQTLGLVKGDEPADAAKVATELADSQRELAVFRLAPQGADVQKMLDSRSFLASIAKIDPTDTAALKAAVYKAVTDNPSFKVAPAATKSGGDLGGGSGEGKKDKPTTLSGAIAAHYSK